MAIPAINEKNVFKIFSFDLALLLRAPMISHTSLLGAPHESPTCKVKKQQCKVNIQKSSFLTKSIQTSGWAHRMSNAVCYSDCCTGQDRRDLRKFFTHQMDQTI